MPVVTTASHIMPYLALTAHPAIGAVLLDPRPAWVWNHEGNRIIWSNAAGLAFFQEQDMQALLDRTFGDVHPARRHLARLALNSRLNAPLLDRLRFFLGVNAVTTTCLCKRLEVEGESMVLVLATDADLPKLDEEESATRLVEALSPQTSVLSAIMDGDSRVLAASSGFESLVDFSEDIDTLLGGADEPAGLAIDTLTEDEPQRIGGVARVGTGLDARYLLIVANQDDESADEVDFSALEDGDNSSPYISEEIMAREADIFDMSAHEVKKTLEGKADQTSMLDHLETVSFVQDGEADQNIDETTGDNSKPSHTSETEAPSNIVTLPFAAASQISLADTSMADSDQNKSDSVITSLEELEEEVTAVISEDDTIDMDELSDTGFVFDKDGGPYHFVWESDEIGRFSFISKDLADAVGPDHAAIVGQSWSDLAQHLNMDEDGQIAAAFAARDTWTGLTVNWPVQDSEVAVPVELTGLPVFGRFHGFQGFRGFGICRTHLAVPFSSGKIQPFVSNDADDETNVEDSDKSDSTESLPYDDPLLSDDLMLAADLAVKTAGAVVSGNDFEEDLIDRSSDEEATQKVADAMHDLLEEEETSIPDAESADPEEMLNLDDDLAAQHAIEGNEGSTPAVLSMTDTDSDSDRDVASELEQDEEDLSHLSKSEQDAFDQIAEALVDEEEEPQGQPEDIVEEPEEKLAAQVDLATEESSDNDTSAGDAMLIAGAATALGVSLSLDTEEADVSETPDEPTEQASEELVETSTQSEKKDKKKKKKHKAAKIDDNEAVEEAQDQDASVDEPELELSKAEKKRLKAEKKRRKEEKKLKAKKLKKARKRKKARKAARLAMLLEKENTAPVEDQADASVTSSDDKEDHDGELAGKAALTAAAAGLIGVAAASDKTSKQDPVSQDEDVTVSQSATTTESLEDEASLSHELASAQANTSITSPEDEASSYQSSNLEEIDEPDESEDPVSENDADIIEAFDVSTDEMIAADAPSIAPIDSMETSVPDETDLTLSDMERAEESEGAASVEASEQDEDPDASEPSEPEETDEAAATSDDDALKSAASIAFRDILAMDPAFRHLHGSKSASADSEKDASKEAMRRRNKSGPRFEALLGGLDQGDDAKADVSETVPEEEITASDDRSDSAETSETIEEVADTSNIVSLTDQDSDLLDGDSENNNLVDLFADNGAPKSNPTHDVIDLASHASALNGDNKPNEPVQDIVEADDEPAELDVTKLAQADTSSKALATILDKVPAALIVSANQSTLYANSKALSLLGFESLEAFETAGGMGALFGGRPGDWLTKTEGLTTLRKQDGAPLSAEAKVSSIQWNGEAAAMLCFEEAKTEAPSIGLSEEDEKIAELEAILDTATDGVVVLDSRAGILRMNHSAEALFEVDRHEMAGESFLDLLAEESHKDAIDYLDGLMANGVASVLNDGREVIGRVSSGGLIPLFMTMGRVAIPGTNRFCAVVRDIAQWKRAEEDLLAEKRRAEKANSQKSDFLAKISHEIRTPLNAIIGFSEVMMDERFGSVGNERYKDYLKDIHTSGSHIMSLINDLLDLSKVEAGKMDLSFQATELNALIQESVGLMQPQANREQIIIRTSLASNLPDVVGDARSLRQIILNLLSNGVKYTPAGGQVIISTSYEENGEVILRIRDTGIGMSEEEVKTALEPFRQVSSTASKGGPGTGLGLPLTKALVEANRAQFSLVSAKDHGTLVEITFPNARVLAS